MRDLYLCERSQFLWKLLRVRALIDSPKHERDIEGLLHHSVRTRSRHLLGYRRREHATHNHDAYGRINIAEWGNQIDAARASEEVVDDRDFRTLAERKLKCVLRRRRHEHSSAPARLATKCGELTEVVIDNEDRALARWLPAVPHARHWR